MGRGARLAPEPSLKARAIQWLAQREHSRLELQGKLLRHAMAEDALAQGALNDANTGPGSSPTAEDPPARVAALLDWLEAHHHLSQQRFVESRVHARASRFGNLRIRQELAQHQLGLPPELASSLKDTELDRARAVWGGRFSGRPAGAAEQAKQARFLAGRGFSGEVIRRVLREAQTQSANRNASASDAD